MKKHIVVLVQGPLNSGKSSVAWTLARILGLVGVKVTVDDPGDPLPENSDGPDLLAFPVEATIKVIDRELGTYPIDKADAETACLLRTGHQRGSSGQAAFAQGARWFRDHLLEKGIL